MSRTSRRRAIATAAVTALTASMALAGLAPSASAQVPDGTRFFVPKPNPDAKTQIRSLDQAGRHRAADRIRALVTTPSAVWVETGSPRQARQQVRQITKQAKAERTVPLLVLYDIPFRDCAQYSAGGATTVAEYEAWVDGVAAGIGNRKAAIALEPDSIGIIPFYTSVDGVAEWCKPAEADAATAAADRFAMLNYAVDRLTALPRTSVYLDGTHNGWLNVGDVSDRLLKAGVAKADGMFFNTSNYQWTQNVEQYGTWVSSCLAYLTKVDAGGVANCGNQYWSGGPANDFTGVSLDPAKKWSDTATDPTANTAGINSRYAAQLGDVEPSKSFLVDTSRNGRGPWVPTAAQAAWPDPQVWCNPPRRGLGPQPTTRTSTPLADAYVWIKVPGESDGQCSRGLGTGNDVVDPIWGRVDPAAGQWFGRQALQLTRLADPELPLR